MTLLPQVTLLAIDTVNYGKTINSMINSLEQIEPGDAVWFTDIFINQPFRIQEIKHLYSKEEYSAFVIKELGKYEFKTSHILITQHDGYVLDGERWKEEWLQYDYIGADWPGETDGLSVGNGGFSLRSVRLHKILAEDPLIRGLQPEDAQICRLYRPYLEDKYQIKFATREVANKFSFELREPTDHTFGFHGNFHQPYLKEPIVFHRSGALGDVLQTEPLMEYFWKKGHKVILNSPYFQLFARHWFPIHSYEHFDHAVIKHRVIDLDMSYETTPAQLHLKSYFDTAGIKDYVLRNPRLNYQITDQNRIFKKYCILHIDDRETTHRNIHGVNWKRVVAYLEDVGLTVIQIGQGPHERVALEYNAANSLVLSYLIAGASLMVAIDSGPAGIAVALNVRSVIMFGSVDPSFIHPDLSKIIVLQSTCPVGLQNCWHRQISRRGVDCVADPVTPPCTILTTERVTEACYKALNL